MSQLQKQISEYQKLSSQYEELKSINESQNIQLLKVENEDLMDKLQVLEQQCIDSESQDKEHFNLLKERIQQLEQQCSEY